MSDNNKEQERSKIHKAIWDTANDLRGSVDGWEFKQYILGFLFYRFISENLALYLNSSERKKNKNFNYADMNDNIAINGRDEILKVKGFFILPSELFENVHKMAPSDRNLNITLEKVFKNIENSALGTPSERDFKGLFEDLNVNSTKLGSSVQTRNEKLVKLFNAIGGLNLGNYNDTTIDIFGDTYEYLMTMYAAKAGKSGGEFFTPQEVSELLARITVVGKDKINKVYDPACGSGSLLLKFAKVFDREKILSGFYGQEINQTTHNLCRINMFLHNINYEKFDIALGDTLIDPYHWDYKPFDAIVSNPPYALSWKGKDDPTLINDPRFAPAGILAPKSKADLAFVMHSLHWLSEIGTAAIVLFPGTLHRVGEQQIRQYLVHNNYVDAVIQLPKDLFFGTTIPTCILVLKKRKLDNRVLFIDASKEFTRISAKNKMEPEHLEKIIKCYTSRSETVNFSRLVDYEEIKETEYRLDINPYIQYDSIREKIEINKLNEKIENSITHQNEIKSQINDLVNKFENEKKSNVEYKTLGELGEFTSGKGLKKEELLDDGIGCIHYGEIYTHYGVYACETKSSVKLIGANPRKAKNGDLIIAAATTAEADSVPKAVAWLGDEEIIIGSDAYIYSHVLNPKYVSYFFRSEQFWDQKRKYVTGTTIKRINGKNMSKIKIPVPSVEEQKRIVDFLDNFTKLMTELKMELKNRDSQYEYYLNDLLVFKEKQ